MNNNPVKNKKAVDLLTINAEQLIDKYPKLKALQEEINRRLSKAPSQESKQEILDIMYKSTRNELHETIAHVGQLLDNIANKLNDINNKIAI